MISNYCVKKSCLLCLGKVKRLEEYALFPFGHIRNLEPLNPSQVPIWYKFVSLSWLDRVNHSGHSLYWVNHMDGTSSGNSHFCHGSNNHYINVLVEEISMGVVSCWVVRSPQHLRLIKFSECVKTSVHLDWSSPSWDCKSCRVKPLLRTIVLPNFLF